MHGGVAGIAAVIPEVALGQPQASVGAGDAWIDAGPPLVTAFWRGQLMPSRPPLAGRTCDIASSYVFGRRRIPLGRHLDAGNTAGVIIDMSIAKRFAGAIGQAVQFIRTVA